MPGCTSTAGSARKPASLASTLAMDSCTPYRTHTTLVILRGRRRVMLTTRNSTGRSGATHTNPWSRGGTGDNDG